MKGSLPISLGVKHRGHPLGLKIENRAFLILESNNRRCILGNGLGAKLPEDALIYSDRRKHDVRTKLRRVESQSSGVGKTG